MTLPSVCCSFPQKALGSPGGVAVGGGHTGLKNNHFSDRLPFTDSSDELSNAQVFVMAKDPIIFLLERCWPRC